MGSPNEHRAKFDYIAKQLRGSNLNMQPSKCGSYRDHYDIFRIITRLQTVLLHSKHCKHQFTRLLRALNTPCPDMIRILMVADLDWIHAIALLYNRIWHDVRRSYVFTLSSR